MKIHTSEFKEEISKLGKELDCIIKYSLNNVEYVLGNEEINEATASFEGAILKSVMKQLDLDVNVNIPVGTILNYQFGVKVNNEYEYINYGNFAVKEVEKQEDTNSYRLLCYDKMLKSMTDYVDLGISYPITIRDYIEKLCNHLGLSFKNKTGEFANFDKEIPSELYLDENKNSLGYTFRDVLDELAQVTASCICINEVSDELEIRYITDTGDTIDEEFLKDVNVKFGEKYGPINTIVLSRSEDTDCVYYPEELPDLPKELKIKDNQIMNFNNRADFLPEIFEKLNGLEFYINDFTSTGICYYELCDRYNVQIDDMTYSCVMFNDEVIVSDGLEEQINTSIPEQTETDYKKADKDDRRLIQALIEINKQKGQILLKVSKDDIINCINMSSEGIVIKASKISLAGKIIDLTGDSIIIKSDNFNVDQEGNVIAYGGSFKNINIRGGDIVLEDDGTAASAALKIKTIQKYGEELTVGLDLTGESLLFEINETSQFLEATTQIIENQLYRDIYDLMITDSGYKIRLISIKQLLSSGSLMNQYTLNLLNENDIKVEDIYVKRIVDNEVVKETFYSKILTPPEDIGIISTLNDLSIIGDIYLSKSIERTTAYSGYGIEADIIADGEFTEEDRDLLQKYLLGEITLTDAQIRKYDVNKDGVVNVQDLIKIQKYIIYNISRSKPGKLIIDTQSINDNIQLIDGDGNVKVSIDLEGIRLDGDRVPTTNLLQMTLTNSITDFSTSYNHFFPFGAGGTLIETLNIGSKLTYETKNVSFGDRTSQKVWGVTIDKGVNAVEVKPCIRFLNNETSKGNISVYVDVVRDGELKTAKLVSDTIQASARHVTSFSYIVNKFGDEELQEGDFIFVRCYKSLEDVDVISSNRDSSLIFEVKN